MSAEANKILVRRFLDEVIGNKNVSVADTYCVTDFAVHFGGAPAVHGIAAWKEFVSSFFNAFPDMHLTIEDMVAEEDKVIGRWQWHATHRGEFMGMNPTGKRVEVTGCGIYRIVDGKIAEEWVQEDILGMLQQLGAIPAMG